MARISLSINDRSYDMTCDDGQEEHLQKLAAHIDERVREMAVSVGPVGEPRLLVMASLVIADELHSAYREIHTLKGDSDGEGAGGNGKIASALESCAGRIEAIAARLEGV